VLNTLPALPAQAASEHELAPKLAREGFDPKLVRSAIVLMRRGAGDLIEQVLSGKLSVAQASAMARGRP
jgi:hypothetical protein